MGRGVGIREGDPMDGCGRLIVWERDGARLMLIGDVESSEIGKVALDGRLDAIGARGTRKFVSILLFLQPSKNVSLSLFSFR